MKDSAIWWQDRDHRDIENGRKGSRYWGTVDRAAVVTLASLRAMLSPAVLLLLCLPTDMVGNKRRWPWILAPATPPMWESMPVRSLTIAELAM